MTHFVPNRCSYCQQCDMMNQNSRESDDSIVLPGYKRANFTCLRGKFKNIDGFFANLTWLFETNHIVRPDPDFGSYYEVIREPLREEIYDINYMSYASPKPNRSLGINQYNQTLGQKIVEYFSQVFEKNRKVQYKRDFPDYLFRGRELVSLNPDFKETQLEQQIYLNPQMRETTFTIAPHSNLTLPAIYFHPQRTKPTSAILLVKNNLTGIHMVSLKGIGGSGKLEFIEVRRQVSIDSEMFERIVRTLIFLNRNNFSYLTRHPFTLTKRIEIAYHSISIGPSWQQCRILLVAKGTLNFRDK